MGFLGKKKKKKEWPTKMFQENNPKFLKLNEQFADNVNV